jgi:acetyl esterase
MRPDAEVPLPVVVYFHGGGWALGDIEIDDVVCRALANAVPAVVVNVDYPLAPENPYPAPLDACSAVVTWLGDHAAEIGGDGARLAVAGESSGGNLAAATAIRLRDEGSPPLALQVLIYPALDSSMSSASYIEFEDGYFLTKSLMDWAWNQYAKAELAHPWVSPLHAPSLAGLPPALVITAEYDPLRDEGHAYAERLRTAGVEATSTDYPGMIHGFYGMGGIFPAAKEALAETVTRLQQAFARS